MKLEQAIAAQAPRFHLSSKKHWPICGNPVGYYGDDATMDQKELFPYIDCKTCRRIMKARGIK